MSGGPISKTLGDTRDAWPDGAPPGAGVTVAAVLRYLVENGQISVDGAAILAQLSGAAGIATFPSAQAAGNNVSLAEVIRYIQENGTDPLVAALGAMTDVSAQTKGATTTVIAYIKGLVDAVSGAAGLATFPAAAAANNGVSLAEVIRYIQENGTDPIVAALGAMTDASAQTKGTTTTVLSYIKGIVDAVSGSAGIAVFPAKAAAGNGVSLAEVIRYIQESGTDLLVAALGAEDDTAVQEKGTDKTAMGYLKGLVDAVAGASGLATWPAAAAPANGVSLSEGLRFISENQLWRTVKKSAAAVAGATTNLFTVTGVCRVRMIGVIQTTVARAGGVVTAEVGVAANTAQLIPQTADIRAAAGIVFGGATVAGKAGPMGTEAVVAAATIIQTLSVAADSGAIDYYLQYLPLSSDGAVVAA